MLNDKTFVGDFLASLYGQEAYGKESICLERVFFGEKCKAKGILECFGGKILKKISKSLFGDILASIYTVQKIPLKHTIMLSLTLYKY